MLQRVLTSSQLARFWLAQLSKRQLTQASTQVAESKDKATAVTEEFTLDANWKKWWRGSYGNHPGKCTLPAVRLPANFIESATVYLSELYDMHQRDKVLAVSKKLSDVLSYRPIQLKPTDDKRNDRRTKSNKEEMMEFFYGKPLEVAQKEQSDKLRTSLWKQIRYDRLNCGAYLIGRAPAAYASTLRVLSEIKKRDPEFAPKAMLDYGSGVGTAVWAANNLWGKGLEDFFCVERSNAMNELSQFLITGGRGDAEITGIYMRPMLPVSFKHTYDVVTAAYTLSELPSEKDRLAMLKVLWEKTRKYLVIVEQGFQQGYHIVMEARNLIAHGIEGADIRNSLRTNSSIKKGHVFAPCPHDKPCPKWKGSGPCSFKQGYFPPMFAKRFHANDGAVQETFSYVIMSKEDPGGDSWPRVISDPDFLRGGRMHCHLCTPTGEIQHLYMKKETHGRDMRFVAKKTLAGDLLPLTPK